MTSMQWLHSLGKVIDIAVKFWEDRQSVFPCRDCLERKVGCHCTCQKYIDVKADYQKQADMVMERHNIEDMADDFRRRTIWKIKKRCNRR